MDEFTILVALWTPLCQELGTKTNYQSKRCSYHPYHSGSYKVLEALYQELGDENQIYISCYITISQLDRGMNASVRRVWWRLFLRLLFHLEMKWEVLEGKCFPINSYIRGWFKQVLLDVHTACPLRPASDCKGAFAGHPLWEEVSQEEDECSARRCAPQSGPTGSEGLCFHWVGGKPGLMVGGRPNQRTYQHLGLPWLCGKAWTAELVQRSMSWRSVETQGIETGGDKNQHRSRMVEAESGFLQHAPLFTWCLV